MPGHDAAVECQDLSFQCLQLAAKSGNARARYFGEPGVICIGNNFEQLPDTVASDRCDDPELSEMGAD